MSVKPAARVTEVDRALRPRFIQDLGLLQQRVFGLQLDEQGRFKPEFSYTYTLNLQEMKAPLIDAVTRSGWTWCPVAWQDPVWLRWLTG